MISLLEQYLSVILENKILTYIGLNFIIILLGFMSAINIRILYTTIPKIRGEKFVDPINKHSREDKTLIFIFKKYPLSVILYSIGLLAVFIPYTLAFYYGLILTIFPSLLLALLLALIISYYMLYGVFRNNLQIKELVKYKIVFLMNIYNIFILLSIMIIILHSDYVVL